MQIVILNTMGRNYARKEVFFRAFPPDELTWIDTELASIGECVEPIVELLDQKTIRHDCHLVITVNLERFDYSEYRDTHERLVRLAKGYIVKSLIEPMIAADCCPMGVSIVFTQYDKKDDQTAPIGNELVLPLIKRAPGVLGMLGYKDADGNSSDIDISCIFANTVPAGGADGTDDATDDSKAKAEELRSEDVDYASADEEPDELLAMSNTAMLNKRKNENPKIKSDSQLETDYSEAIANAQEAKVPRDRSKSIEPNHNILKFHSPDTKIQNADLQINLAGLIKALLDHPASNFEVRAHTSEELKAMLESASASIETLLGMENKVLYYPLEPLYDDSRASSITTELNNMLVEQIPKAIADVSAEQTDASDKSHASKLGIARKLRGAVIALNRAQKAFRERYKEFLDMYDGEAAERQENAVFAACASAYAKWRRDARANPGSAGPLKESLEVRPEIEKQTYDELEKARALCENGALEALREYGDARERASELKNEFLQASRVWSPDPSNGGTKKFYIFCAVAALIFVLILVTPFVLLDSETYTGSLAVPFIHLAGAGALLLLYAWCVLKWLRRRCSRINELSAKLLELTRICEKDRNASIDLAKRVYGHDLPMCMIRQMNVDAMERIDRLNADCERRVEMHRGYLTEIRNEIDALFTALRIDRSHSRLGAAHTDRDRQAVSMNWLLPPYAAANRDAYMPFNTPKE